MKRILVTEDDRHLREEICYFLKGEGFEVIEAKDGQEGLDMAKSQNPDLILSDIKMPRMDGLDFLKAIRKNSPTYLTPFIFLSVKNKQKEIEDALALGAQEYITKPFDLEVVIENIKWQLKLLDYRRKLERKNRRLQALNAQKKSLLKQKINTVRMITHYIRNALTTAMGYTDMLKTEVENPRWQKKLEAISKSTNRINKKINALLDGYKSEKGEIDLGKCAKIVVDDNMDNALLKGQNLSIEKIDQKCLVLGNKDELIMAIDNLVGNGLKHTADLGEKQIKVSVENNSDFVYFRVKDKGPGLTRKQIDQLINQPLNDDNNDFDIDENEPHGFGIRITKTIVEEHSGELLIESEPGKGAIFTLKIPSAPK